MESNAKNRTLPEHFISKASALTTGNKKKMTKSDPHGYGCGGLRSPLDHPAHHAYLLQRAGTQTSLNALLVKEILAS